MCIAMWFADDKNKISILNEKGVDQMAFEKFDFRP